MFVATLKAAVLYYPRSAFAALGLMWLVIEPAIGLTGNALDLTYWQVLGWSAALGVVWLMIDGLRFAGFLKQKIDINSNAFDTRIVIKFGDIFREQGWRAIAVNDFFDAIVDDHLVSSKSLHGVLLQEYWAGNTDDWNRQVEEQLSGTTCSSETRNVGKQDRYAIGTTAAVKTEGDRYLCVALSHTDISNQETRASATDLHQAVRGLLRKARSVCANERLSIPLMGSGLSRVGIKNNVLLHLILVGIFEETKINKITSEICIVLPREKVSELNLASVKKDWS